MGFTIIHYTNKHITEGKNKNGNRFGKLKIIICKFGSLLMGHLFKKLLTFAKFNKWLIRTSTGNYFPIFKKCITIESRSFGGIVNIFTRFWSFKNYFPWKKKIPTWLWICLVPDDDESTGSCSISSSSSPVSQTVRVPWAPVRSWAVLGCGAREWTAPRFRWSSLATQPPSTRSQIYTLMGNLIV